MAVDPKEKNEMARLIALMNQGVNFEESHSQPKPETRMIESSIPVSDLDPSIAAMKSILEAFHGTQSPDRRLADRSDKDRELREALVTEITDRGTRVGSWEIIINEDDQGLKNFDVTNVHTGEPIAVALTVYDAALAITRHLNEGRTINSREIREILNTEASYDSSRQDAAIFRSRMESSQHIGNKTRAAVMEARYVESLEKAKTARVKLSRLSR
jgi:hypothetical protein